MQNNKEPVKEGGLRCKGVTKADSESSPLITYVTVALNRAGTIEKCIKSVLAQQNANFEYIIIDGASTDGTLEIIKRYENQIDYYISEKDSGIYNAMNKGLKLAKGRLICFINSDDECLPAAAETVTKYYLQYKPDMVCGGRILKQNGEVQNEVLHRRFPVKHSCFRYIQMFHQSTYASKELFAKIGGFDEQYTLLADWVWESKAIDAGAKICFIDEKLSVFNNDGASFSCIVKRDKEWTDWIISQFPFLSKKHAWFLLNCLNRGRHYFVLISTVRKFCRQYVKEQEFIKAVYETSLCLVLESLEELQNKYVFAGLDINSLFEKYKKDLNCNYKSVEELHGELVNAINESLISKEIKANNEFIDFIRDFEVKAYSYYIKHNGIKTKSLRDFVSFILKKVCLWFSYISRKSVFLSKIFIGLVRNGRLVQFAHKILPAGKWKQL